MLKWADYFGRLILVFSALTVLYLHWAIYDNLRTIQDYGFGPPEVSVVDSISAAQQLGRLDIVSALLGIIGVLVALGALFGFWFFRREAIGAAKEAAEAETPSLVQRYMDKRGQEIIRSCLDESEVVARLEERFNALGLEDTESADSVDSKPDWRPDEQEQRYGHPRGVQGSGAGG